MPRTPKPSSSDDKPKRTPPGKRPRAVDAERNRPGSAGDPQAPHPMPGSTRYGGTRDEAKKRGDYK